MTTLILAMLAAGADVVPLDNAVAKVLEANCVTCHRHGKAKGGLRLDTSEGLAKGGNSGPAIVPGKSSESRLMRAVSGTDPELSMPPKPRKSLSSQESGYLASWIDKGARWNDSTRLVASGQDTERTKPHWAFQPVMRPKVPGDAVPLAAIDAFLRQRLASEGLAPSPEADRQTLLRRVWLDLTGLPPTLGEIRLYENDQAQGAYERMVDRAMASPHFGERWAGEAETAFSRVPVSCHLAVDAAGKICGFACHDVTFRGFFGPAGVPEKLRGRGLGTALLLTALHSLAAAGYAYAVIGGSGDDDFYAKAVGAVPIPDSEPGPYGAWR